MNITKAPVFKNHYHELSTEINPILSLEFSNIEKPIINVIDGAHESSIIREKINDNKIPIAELVDYIIEKHHKYAKEFCPVISSHIRTMTSKHGENHSNLIHVEVLFNEILKRINEHLLIKEMVLFPRIKLIEEVYSGLKENKGISHVKSIIKVMMTDHKGITKLMNEIRDLTDNFAVPDDSSSYYRLAFIELQQLEKNFNQAANLEHSTIYPKALEMLNKL
jgi:regulator of cell morphogenesis and NO signaling